MDMDKKKGILLVLLFGILFFNGTKTFALDQPNFDSEEQTVVFHLIEEKGGNAFMDKQPSSDPNQKNEASSSEYAFNKKQSIFQRWRMFPRTNDTKLLILSFIGTLFVGLAFLILWSKRRESDEMEKN